MGKWSKMMRKWWGTWWGNDGQLMGTYGKMTGKWWDIWTLIGTIMEQYVKIIGKKMEKWKHMENDRVVKCYPGNRWKWSKQLFSKKTVKKNCTRTCAQTKSVKKQLYQNLCPNKNCKNKMYQKVANSGSLRLWQICCASFIHAESRSLFCSF